jgi:hypothetical protein
MNPPNWRIHPPRNPWQRRFNPVGTGVFKPQSQIRRRKNSQPIPKSEISADESDSGTGVRVVEP